MSIRHTKLALMIAAFLLIAASCNPYQNFAVEDAALGRISLKGMKALTVKLDLTLKNPSAPVKVQNLQGYISADGTPMLELTTDEFKVAGWASQTISVPVSCKIVGNGSISDIIGFRSAQNLNRLTVSLTGDIKGPLFFKKKIDVQDVPLKDLMDKLW